MKYNLRHRYSNYALSFGLVDYGQPDWQTLLNKALSNLSTSAGVVSLPNFIWELRELPQLIKWSGDLLLGRPNGLRPDQAHLAYTFGWAPFIADLQTFANFAENVESRLKRIYDAEESHSISGGIGGESHQDSSDGSLSNPYRVSEILWYKDQDMRRRTWYSAKLTPDYSVPRFSSEMQKVGWALGFHNKAKALWDALPWSFMIDYFLSIGDFIEAKSAEDQVSSICIMCNDKYWVRSTLVPSYGWEQVMTNNGVRHTERKMRRVFSNPTAIPSLALSTLGQKLPILGSLATSAAYR
jgi:hypothetical protein